jgi:hypothetical protein
MTVKETLVTSIWKYHYEGIGVKSRTYILGISG